MSDVFSSDLLCHDQGLQRRGGAGGPDPHRALRDLVVSAPSAFLAVDWDTTNRRVFRFEGDAVAHTERDDRGAASVTDFAGEVAAIRERFGDLPMLLAGMVG